MSSREKLKQMRAILVVCVKVSEVARWRGSGAAGQRGSGAAGQRGSGAAGQRGSGAAGQRGKVAVFGLLKSGGNFFTTIIPIVKS
jgi:hypothetical protein